MNLIKDAEMSFTEGIVGEGNVVESLIGLVLPIPVTRLGTSSAALALAVSKVLEMKEERDKAMEAATLAQEERGNALAERDGISSAYQRLQREKAKIAWEEVIRAGTEALKEEEGLRAVIESYRVMLDSVKSP